MKAITAPSPVPWQIQEEASRLTGMTGLVRIVQHHPRPVGSHLSPNSGCKAFFLRPVPAA